MFTTGIHSLNTSIILLATVVALQFFCQIIYYNFFHPLRHYPAPFWAGVTRLWSAWHYFRDTETEVLWQAVKKYADSTLTPAVYHRRSTKARWFPEGLFRKPGILVVRDPFKHSAHRRLHSLTFLERGQPVDLAVWSALLSCDTITDVAFRKPLGFVESEKDVDNLIHIFQAGTVLIGAVARVYQLFNLLKRPRLKKYFQGSPEQGLWFGSLMKRSNQVLANRAKALQEGRIVKPEKGDDDYDFLQAFMDTRTPEGNFLDAETIQSEILSLWVQEVANSLPFFNACIRESMRLHPVSSVLLPREMTPLDPEIETQGRKVPLGVELAANTWISHKDKAVYGEDAEEFKQVRLLNDPVKAKELEKYNLAFGAGSRVCLGKDLAMAMLYKAPVALFMRFDVTLCKETPQTPKPSSKMNDAVRAWKNIWLNLRRREPWVAVREN
ncbi:cytochrome P450 [Aspergillus foveolatus]|uniref:cytochrome P450 n=1 Tax=Aspergillus foveolatus TaxID=210207 RepID=UPI003CCCAE19